MIDDGADRQRLAGHQDLRTLRYRCGFSLRSTAPGKHVLGHESGDNRDDQRSNEQCYFLDVHGDYASPKGPLNAA